MSNKQVKFGAIFSYILIILNATYGLFLTPFIIDQIGDASYGVYKTISAFTASLMVLDLGLGGTMMRYIAKYRADSEDDKIPNFVFMGGIQASVICICVSIVTFVLYSFLDVIYQNGLTTEELIEAKKMYVFLAIGIIAHVIENLINGVISGYNRFFFANGIKIIRLIVRISAIVVFIAWFKNPIAIVIIDLLCTIFFLIAEIIYVNIILKLKIRFTRWDGSAFVESFRYTILMFLTSIVVQANSNFSNVVIGAIINSEAVTVYSMAVMIFGMYEQLSTAISGVMLPTVTSALKNDDTQYTKTISIVVSAGRVQFILLGAVLVGFCILGKSFIDIWLGGGYEDVYYLVLILLCPALLELCVNVCLSILRAKNMLGFRTIVITLSTVLNLAITIIGMKYIGYYSAALGTACSFLFGSVITMGIYYYKKLRINILHIYKKIFNRIWICQICSGLSAFAISLIFSTSLLKFIGGFCSFCIVYAASLLLFGLNNTEKQIILSKVRRNKS